MVWHRHKGVEYSASTQESLDKMIKDREYERSIFYRSRVYTYSCVARDVDHFVEFTEYFDNGETKKITTFRTREEFWDSID